MFSVCGVNGVADARTQTSAGDAYPTRCIFSCLRPVAAYWFWSSSRSIAYGGRRALTWGAAQYKILRYPFARRE